VYDVSEHIDKYPECCGVLWGVAVCCSMCMKLVSILSSI